MVQNVQKITKKKIEKDFVPKEIAVTELESRGKYTENQHESPARSQMSNDVRNYRWSWHTCWWHNPGNNIPFQLSNEGKLLLTVDTVVSQFSLSVVSDSLGPHEPLHTRPACPLPTPGVHPNPCPSSQWCHRTISSSVIPFSSHLQSFPVSGSFQMSQFFAWGGQSIGVSASGPVLPMNIQGWFPLGWTGWISLQSKGLSRVSFPSFEVVYCSMSGSNCCFFTCLQVSLEASEVV